MYFLWFVIVLNYNTVSSPAISSSSCISCLDNSTAKSYKQKEKIKIDTTPITDYLKSIDMTTLAAEKLIAVHTIENQKNEFLRVDPN